MALGAPTLWSNVYIIKSYTEKTREAARINLERSKACPLFLTWFPNQWQSAAETQEVIDDLIIPYANRWQRITLIAEEEVAAILFIAMGHLDFEILQDLEISRLPSQSPLSWPTLCRSAPLLRRCRLSHVPPLPPLPSNLVVLDCLLTRLGDEPFNLDPLLEFLPHVAHSLEHLRFESPTFDVLVTPRKSRITLQNLKSLLVKDSNDIVEHLFTPNLTHLAASFIFDGQQVAETFYGFSAPKLQSIRFDRTTLLPLVTLHDLPSMFPQLESAMFEGCFDESAFIDLLKPPLLPPLQKAAEHPPKHHSVENPFPKLKELAISDVDNLTSLQAVIESRRKNGDKSLRTVHLPKKSATEGIIRDPTHWLPKQGIELVLYKSWRLRTPAPLVFQDDFCNEDSRLFNEIMDEDEWDDGGGSDFDDWTYGSS